MVFKNMVFTRVIPRFSFVLLLLFTVPRLKTRVEMPWIDFPIYFLYKNGKGGGMVSYLRFMI